MGGKCYWISDANAFRPWNEGDYDRGIFCCDPADIANPEKHTLLFNPQVESGSMIIQDGVILAAHCGPASPMNTGFIISTDMGKTWAQYDLKEFGKRSPHPLPREERRGLVPRGPEIGLDPAGRGALHQAKAQLNIIT